MVKSAESGTVEAIVTEERPVFSRPTAALVAYRADSPVISPAA